MITRLLTHEWLRTRAVLGIILGLAALAVGLGSALVAIGWPVLSTLGLVVGAVTLVVLTPAVQLALTIDFWRSSYSRTGYFTHAIPLRGATIYFAKLAWGALVTLLSLVITLALVAVFWLAVAPTVGAERNPFVAAGDLWAGYLEVMPAGLLVSFAVLLVLSYLLWLAQMYFAVTVGSQASLNRLGLGGPVLVFAALYAVSQVVLFFGMLAVPFGIGMVGDQLGVVDFPMLMLMTSGAASPELMPIGFIPPLFLLGAVCVAWSAYSWNRKISLA